MSITLHNIELAIRANFVLSKDPKKFLEVEDSRKRCLGLARIVFVGVARTVGYTQKEICAYLHMTIEDYNGKSRKFREHITQAEMKVAETGKTNSYDAHWNLQIDMIVYLKTRLVRNYLSSLQRVALELF